MTSTHQTKAKNARAGFPRQPAGPRAPRPIARGPFALAGLVMDRFAGLASRGGPAMLRCGLAVVFIWFGALKVTGRSDVFGLVAKTLPFVDPHIFVPALGYLEMLLGIGLFAGNRVRRFLLAGMALHLSGTFLTFLDASAWMFHNHNPLLLTMDGEFVLKNFVLISAAIVLLGLAAGSRQAAAGAGARAAGTAAAPVPLVDPATAALNEPALSD